MESGAITDEQISASTEFGPTYGAKYGRLHLKGKPGNVGSWSSLTSDTNQWLQIDLANDRTSVSRVATQGRNDYNQFVTKYQLQYSEDGVTFHYYSEQGQGQAKVILLPLLLQLLKITVRMLIIINNCDPFVVLTRGATSLLFSCCCCCCCCCRCRLSCSFSFSTPTPWSPSQPSFGLLRNRKIYRITPEIL